MLQELGYSRLTARIQEADYERQVKRAVGVKVTVGPNRLAEYVGPDPRASLLQGMVRRVVGVVRSFLP